MASVSGQIVLTTQGASGPSSASAGVAATPRPPTLVAARTAASSALIVHSSSLPPKIVGCQLVNGRPAEDGRGSRARFALRSQTLSRPAAVRTSRAEPGRAARAALPVGSGQLPVKGQGFESRTL